MEKHQAECHKKDNEVSSEDELLKTTFNNTINSKQFNRQLIYKKLAKLMDRIKVTEFCNSKTRHCKHCEATCYAYVIAGFKNSFKKAFMLKVVIEILFMILKRKIMFSIDTIRFAMFPALFSLIYRSLLCYMRHVRDKEDGLNAIVSSLAGSCSLFLDDDRSRRQKIALYTAIRAMQSLAELSDRRGFIKKIPQFEIFTYMASTAVPCYLYCYEKDICPKAAYAIDKIGFLQHTQRDLLIAWNRQFKWKYS